jgi:hypothetical protein
MTFPFLRTFGSCKGVLQSSNDMFCQFLGERIVCCDSTAHLSSIVVQ